MNWTQAAILIEFILVIAVPVVSYFSVRSLMAKTAQEVEKRVRDALQEENKILRTRLKRLDRLMLLIVDTLKKTHRIDIEIDNDIVTMRDAKGTLHVARITTGDLGA